MGENISKFEKKALTESIVESGDGERVRRKGAAFRKLFKLGEAEELVFDCSGKLLLTTPNQPLSLRNHHARMFLSSSYLCFYSDLFRRPKRDKFAFEEIVRVDKLVGEKEDTLYEEKPRPSAQIPVPSSPVLTVPNNSRSLPNEMRALSVPDSVMLNPTTKQPIQIPKVSGEKESDVYTIVCETRSGEVIEFVPTGTGGKLAYDHVLKAWKEIQGEVKTNKTTMVITEISATTLPEGVPSVPEQIRVPSNQKESQPEKLDQVMYENDESELEGDEGEEWICGAANEEGWLNKNPSEMVELVHEHFFDKISVKEFFIYFLADCSRFDELFHSKRGDKAVQATKWRNCGADGVVREKRYIAKVEGVPGVSFTKVIESQRYFFTTGDLGSTSKLVFEISATMPDIPAGNSFRVETHFEITDQATGCVLTIKTDVNFVSRVLFLEGTIRKSTISVSKVSYNAWIAFAHEYLENNPTPPNTLPTTLSSPRRGTSQQPQIQPQTQPQAQQTPQSTLPVAQKANDRNINLKPTPDAKTTLNSPQTDPTQTLVTLESIFSSNQFRLGLQLLNTILLLLVTILLFAINRKLDATK